MLSCTIRSNFICCIFTSVSALDQFTDKQFEEHDVPQATRGGKNTSLIHTAHWMTPEYLTYTT